jgi:hypothetical protein
MSTEVEVRKTGEDGIISGVGGYHLQWIKVWLSSITAIPRIKTTAPRPRQGRILHPKIAVENVSSRAVHVALLLLPLRGHKSVDHLFIGSFYPSVSLFFLWSSHMSMNPGPWMEAKHAGYRQNLSWQNALRFNLK